MSVSPEFAELLSAGRPEFNSRIAEARQRYSGFKTELLSDFLQTCVDPLIVQSRQEHRGQLVSAAFDIAIDIVGRELHAGHTQGKLMQRLWLECLPTFGGILDSEPEKLLGALCNALLNLSAQPSVRCEQWLELLNTHATEFKTSNEVVEFGMLAAWRAGATQYRTSALRIAAKRPELSAAVLDLPDSNNFGALLQQLETNPWLNLEKKQTPIDVGAFSGFGGSFSQPPQLRACAAGFIVKSDQRYSLLQVDNFGHVLLPSTGDAFDNARDYQPAIKAPIKLDHNILQCTYGRVDINLPSTELQLTSNEHSAALFSPYSFSIIVVPI